MELRKFKSFLVVAKELHFGKAAEKLNITQPALTHQILQLEIEVGFDLFDKEQRTNHRKVVLTEAGIYLAKEISRLVELFDRTILSAQKNSEKRKQLRLGLPMFCYTENVVDIIKSLQNKFPATTFKIVEFTKVLSVQEALFKGNIDIGVTTFPLVFKGLDCQIFKEVHVDVLISMKHPLANYKQIKIEQLRNEKWIDLSKDLCPPILDEIEVLCRNAGFSREANIVQEVSNVELQIGLVKAGIGVAIFPSFITSEFEDIVAKKLVFSEDKQLELSILLAFKETLDVELQLAIKDTVL